ncbi:hypothetical protein SAMN05428970_0806 [Agromyces sp. CF514]|uniref:hypothetical protein n=1 Tax=Agromyces sp. CF514 TaxID=1881031 RepID=UPI0008ED0ACE|nr:hypothetical protein [Agromyces sp. CF514]SFR69871.1 hypothetical protein SAMN05428970_0806 [Agromyces sp. CF514]
MRPPRPLPEQLRSAPFVVALALDAGVSRRRLRHDALARPFHGVRSATAVDTVESRAVAYAAAMAGDHVFSHATAALLHGMPLPLAVEREVRVHVTALAQGRAPRGRGVIGHSTRAEPVVTAVRGLAVLGPADTWCSLAGMLSLDDLVAAGDRLVGLPVPLSSFELIDEAIVRHGRRPGRARLRLARAQLRANSYSRRESLARLSLVRAGLPEPELVAILHLRSGRSTKGDLVFRRHRVLVEYDGDQHRTDDRQWATDVSRLNDLVADGWIVIRMTKRMSRAELVARVIRALEDRGWRP